MIIKIKRPVEDYITTKPHAPDYTRRRFLQFGLMNLSALYALPTLAGLLRSDPAMAAAATAGFGSINATFTSLENAGGHGLARMIVPFREVKDGVGTAFAPGDATAIIGLHSSHGTSNSVIKGLTLNTSDTFYKCLTEQSGRLHHEGAWVGDPLLPAAKLQSLLAKISGTLVACPCRDDNAESPLNPMAMIQQLRIGSVVSSLAIKHRPMTRQLTAQFDTASAFSRDKNEFVSSMILQNSATDAKGLGNQVQSTLLKLAQGQMKQYGGLKGFDSLSKAYEVASPFFTSRFDDSSVRSPIDPDFAANKALFPYLSTFSSTRTDDAVLKDEKNMLMGHLANVRQFAGSLHITESDYDYHDGGHKTSDWKHSVFARNLILWAAAHDALGKDGVLCVFSDGSIAWTNEAEPNAKADNPSVAMGAIFVFKANGNPPTMKAMGRLLAATGSSAESGDRNYVVAQEPKNQAIAGALTYAKVAGLLDNSASQAFILGYLKNTLGKNLSMDEIKANFLAIAG